MKIAIANDMALAVATLKKVLQEVPDSEIVWVARDGQEAIALCASQPPDLILMDLIMPGTDGVEATRAIMKANPCPILVVTASISKNVAKVQQALGCGAMDAVETPTLSITGPSKSGRLLLAKIATLRKSIATKSQTTSKVCLLSPPISPTLRTAIPLIAIGSSTGGPKVLGTILSQLPKDFPAAIAIVQHVDSQFASGMATWLNAQTTLPVKVATSGESLSKSKVWLAATNDHLQLQPDGTFGYTPEPRDYPYRPSVDVFFASLARHWPRRDCAILLTGMGRDGAIGLKQLRDRGWHTIAQDRGSCTVYGMPKAAIELGAAVEVLSPEQIGQTLKRRINFSA